VNIKWIYICVYILLNVDADAMTCIHHAIARGHFPIVKYLLTRFDSLCQVIDEEFNATLLHWAACYAQPEILRYLLANYVEIGVNIRCCDGSTALMWAVSSGDVDSVNTLLEYKADVFVHDKSGQTCLHIAAILGSLPIVKQLLDQGNIGLIGLIDKDGNSAFKLATNSEVTMYLKNKSGKKK
jgi:ankyrin repeat protein